MEQRSVLSLGDTGSRLLTPTEVVARLGAGPPAGVRRSADATRGDHDLNPDLHPDRPLASAAVLVPLIAHPNGIAVLLTLRTLHLADHAGQVSFPGGRIDPGDADEVDAALREATEEVGLARGKVEIVGRLDTYVTRTGYRIAPLVGLIAPPVELRPNPDEVAEIFEVPLDFLVDPANRRRDSRLYQGRERFFWAMRWERHYIWGATAGMLVNLAELLGGGP